MAIFKQGNMWTRWGKVDLFCITTNATVKNDGSLVMGRGIAKEARNRFAGIDKIFGNYINDYIKIFGNDYGLLITNEFPGQKIGAFQVKYHFSNQAHLSLIRSSTAELFHWIVVGSKLDKITVCLNFPGIGNGGLNREDVLPIVMLLPDNVEIWEYE